VRLRQVGGCFVPIPNVQNLVRLLKTVLNLLPVQVLGLGLGESFVEDATMPVRHRDLIRAGGKAVPDLLDQTQSVGGGEPENLVK
jgi:hypothetical protein